MRKFVAIVAALLLGLIPLSRALAVQSIPSSTSNGVHLAAWFDGYLAPGENGGTDYTPNEKGVYDFVLGAHDYNASDYLNDTVTGVPHLYYYPWRLDGGSNGDSCYGFEDSNPDWIEYSKPGYIAWTNGNPQKNQYRCPIDFSNQAVLAHMMSRWISPALTSKKPFDGVVFDVCSTVNGEGREGHYSLGTTLSAPASPPAASITVASVAGLSAGQNIAFGNHKNNADLEFNTISSISGNTIYLGSPLTNSHQSGEWLGYWIHQYDGLPTDTVYETDVIKAMQTIYGDIKGVNHAAYVAINDQHDTWDTTTDQNHNNAFQLWRSFIGASPPVTDIVLDEGGFSRGGLSPNYYDDTSSNGTMTTNTWLSLEQDFEWAQDTAHKMVVLMNYESYDTQTNMTSNPANSAARADIQYVEASYLLENEGQEWFMWRVHGVTCPPANGVSDCGQLFTQVEESAKLGLPTSEMTMDGNLYERQYQSGVVFVNESDQYTYSAGLGSGFYDLYGNPYPGPVTLGPHSAVILVK